MESTEKPKTPRKSRAKKAPTPPAPTPEELAAQKRVDARKAKNSAKRARKTLRAKGGQAGPVRS